jgi:DNA polymerase elongation subunit (family B)
LHNLQLWFLRYFVSQGIATVRRDNCELVRQVVATSLDSMPH